MSFRRRMDEYEVLRYRAVATSAVREAKNGAKLVERIRDESGIELETISGSEGQISTALKACPMASAAASTCVQDSPPSVVR